jgi:transcription-repair coupling factor (superfamily II helicase)
MELPKLTAGKRFTLPRPPGSADALLLGPRGPCARSCRGRRTAIVTSRRRPTRSG